MDLFSNGVNKSPSISSMKDLKGKALTLTYSGNPKHKFLNVPRKVVSVNTVGMKLEGGSFLDFYPKSRYEIKDNVLTLYSKGERELNKEELHVLGEGFNQAMIAYYGSMKDYKERCEIDALSDGSSTYYASKSYFEKSGFGYLHNLDHPSKRVLMNSGGHDKWRVEENTLKGAKELEYKITD